MKRNPWPILVLVTVLSFSVFSCGLFPGPCGCGEPPLPSPGKVEAYFDNVSWLSTSARAVMSNGRITLTGYGESIIQFSVEGTSPGNYQGVVFFTPAAGSIDSASYSSAYGGNAAWIEIVAVDKKMKTVSGRFNCLATNGKHALDMQGGFAKIPYVETPYNTFNGKVNDSDFKPVAVGAKTSDNKIDVNFYKENGETINLSLPSDISEGDHELGEAYRSAFISATAESYKALTGSITITEHNLVLHRISGTFNFVADPTHSQGNSVNITDAVFSVYY